MVCSLNKALPAELDLRAVCGQAPDYQADYDAEKTKDLKWRIVCAGVQGLIKEKRLKEEDVMLWLDWQSIYQARACFLRCSRTPPPPHTDWKRTPTALRVYPCNLHRRARVSFVAVAPCTRPAPPPTASRVIPCTLHGWEALHRQ